ncbi:MAG: NAD(P)H-dependent oxidoreductase subunit E [Hyphomicrobiales bacterium]|nr:NAD(P)H-dependent oxidoreductase subunit E [Hyphomicrobiales bacterium]
MTGEGDVVARVLDHRRADPTELLQILREIQEELDWISPEIARKVAAGLRIPVTQVESVVQFYAFLHGEPRGRYRILFSDNITDRMLDNLGLFEHMLKRLKLKRGETSADGAVSVDLTSCTGMCDQGPALLVNNRAVTRMTARRVDEICDLVRSDVPLSEWPAGFFRVEDNIRRADALLGTRYEPGSSLKAAIALGRQGMLDEMKHSNLRGRGGAGFPASVKWESCRNAPGAERYVVCNADEGEPGTFKDRVLLTSFADRVFEGMAIAGFVVGAARGFVYLRGEYRYLLEPLEAKLAAMRRDRRLGASICGAQGFDFDIEIHLGAGAYICGEASALIESLEGKPGRPRIIPPRLVEVGYLGKPTVVDNVETLADATDVALHGGRKYAGYGTRRSAGTKLLSVSGDCARPGIYEYSFGVRVEQVLKDCGAGEVAAVQVSGPSGVCLTPDEFRRHIAFEDVPTGGAFMVFGKERDLLEVARNFVSFFAHESCGFCTPCRVGTKLMRDALDKITDGHGSRYEINELMRLVELLRRTSHCGLGQTAGNPVRDTWLKFRPAYERRLIRGDFDPAVDLDKALGPAREIAGREDAASHIGHPP